VENCYSTWHIATCGGSVKLFRHLASLPGVAVKLIFSSTVIRFWVTQLIFIPITSLLSFEWIVSTVFQFTCNIKGPSNIHVMALIDSPIWQTHLWFISLEKVLVHDVHVRDGGVRRDMCLERNKWVSMATLRVATMRCCHTNRISGDTYLPQSSWQLRVKSNQVIWVWFYSGLRLVE